MGLPARPAPPGHRRPATPPAIPVKAKTAVLEIVRSDNGDATYRLLIDGVPQKLGASDAKWDDASPWESGSYGAEFSKLRGKYDAFLIEYPPNRSQIKFHLGTETGHSEGCIVTKNANIVEIEKLLADNGIAKNSLKFDVKGDFPIGFKLSIKNGLQEVSRGNTLTLTLELTGGGAPGGVSKDLWFHIVADHLDAAEVVLVHPEKMPLYVSRSSYPDTKKGVHVRLKKGGRMQDYDVRVVAPHVVKPPVHAHAAGRNPVAAREQVAAPSSAVPTSAPDPGIAVVFSIDNYKILNQAPGPDPYYYTPSNYKMVLALGTKTDEIRVKPAPGAAVAAPAQRRQP